MSSPIDLTEDPVDRIPSDIVRDWLPTSNEAVQHLFVFDRYPSGKRHYFKPPDLAPLLHDHSILGFNPTTLLQLGPPTDPSISKAYRDAIRSAAHPVHSVSLFLDPAFEDLVKMPVWIFDYWGEIQSAMSYRADWETALVWLHSHSESPVTAGRCHELMMALSFFPWSGNNIAVENIATLFASSSQDCRLASFHTDYVVGHMSNQHRERYGVEVSGRHVLVGMDILATIVNFYGSLPAPVKTGNHLWERLAKIENRIVKGEVDSVGGVHYLPGHWVSVVFDIKGGCVLFGCSLKRKIPRVERYAFTRWIWRLGKKTVNVNSILVHQLPTGYQDDAVSCGLFALNAIGHHYLGHQLLPTNQISLACARMDIALDLLNGNTVCPFYYTPFHT